MRRLVYLCISSVVLIGLASKVSARQHLDCGYSFANVWSAAVRLLRVDLGYEVGDRDEEAGYVLFQYQDGDKTYPGSVELIRAPGSGSKVRALVTIPAMPSYIERMVADKLRRKLFDEYGPPIEVKVDVKKDDAKKDDGKKDKEQPQAPAQDQKSKGGAPKVSAKSQP